MLFLLGAKNYTSWFSFEIEFRHSSLICFGPDSRSIIGKKRGGKRIDIWLFQNHPKIMSSNMENVRKTMGCNSFEKILGYIVWQKSPIAVKWQTYYFKNNNIENCELRLDEKKWYGFGYHLVEKLSGQPKSIFCLLFIESASHPEEGLLLLV
jgi:hypothetical protein